MRMLLRALALTVALVAAQISASLPARAQEATLVTPGAPLPMTALKSFLDAALLSVGSCNRGTSAPANGPGNAAFAGECWLDTASTPWIVYVTPDAVNWVEVGTLNPTTLQWTPYFGTSPVLVSSPLQAHVANGAVTITCPTCITGSQLAPLGSKIGGLGGVQPGGLIYGSAFGLASMPTPFGVGQVPLSNGGNAPAWSTFSLPANIPAGSLLYATQANLLKAVAIDGTTIVYSNGKLSAVASVSGANPTATAGPNAINGSAATFMRSDAAPAIQLGSASVFGIVEVDGTTITASGGVISAVGGGGTPGGSNGQGQYNNSGVLGGISGLTTDGTNVSFVSTTAPTLAAGKLFLGGALTSISFPNANGEGLIYVDAAGGLVIAGDGSSQDIRLLAHSSMLLGLNFNTTSVQIANGTSNIVSLSAAANNVLQLGGASAGTVNAQTLQMMSGSGTNISGQNFTIIGSLSTGTATDGDIIFKTGVKNGSSGSGAATATTAMTIKGETQQVNLAGSVMGFASKTLTVNNSLTLAGTDGKSLTLTNGLTVTTNDGTLAFGAASKTLTIDNSLELAGTDSTKMTFPSSSAHVAVLDLTDQTVTGGVVVTSLSQSTGSITVDPGARPLQYITNGGNFTITAPTNDGSFLLLVTNNASAGTISFSGFTVGSSTGDALDTTNTHKFTISIWRINSVAGYRVAAMQ